MKKKTRRPDSSTGYLIPQKGSASYFFSGYSTVNDSIKTNRQGYTHIHTRRFESERLLFFIIIRFFRQVQTFFSYSGEGGEKNVQYYHLPAKIVCTVLYLWWMHDGLLLQRPRKTTIRKYIRSHGGG